MRSRQRILVASVALLLLAAGCSSSGGGDEAGTPSSTASTASTTTTARPTDADPELVEAIEQGLENRDGIAIGITFSAAQATCTAPIWAEVLQRPLEATGIEPGGLPQPSFSPTDLDLDVDQGYLLVDAVVGCGAPAYETYRRTLSGGLDDEQTSCLASEFDDEIARRFLAESLTMRVVSTDLKAELDEIYAGCGID